MNPKLHLVETLRDAIDFFQWINKNSVNTISIDTETIGLSWWEPDFTRTVQFGNSEDGWVVPVSTWPQLIKDAFEAHLGQLVMHNAKFDLHALESLGVYVPEYRVEDTMLMAWLINPMESHALKTLSKKYIGHDAGVGQQLLNRAFRENGWTWATVPVDFPAYWTYSALDTVLTYELYQKFQPEMEKLNLKKPYELELAVMQILRRAERRGARLDIDYTKELSMQWHFKSQELAYKLKLKGIENPNANKQIEVALMSEGWEPDEFTATGQAKLDANVLKGLDSETAQLVLDYKRLTKWNSTYLETFISQEDNGVLHASINTLRAKTGRMSVNNPALQTLPRGSAIRNCIIAGEGRSLYAIDYSQIEYRLFAHFCQEESMISAFLEGKDFHAATAELIYGSDFTDAQRSIAKNGNFATLYGAGPRKFAKTCGISEQEAASFLQQYKSRYTRAIAFIQEVENVAGSRLANEGSAYILTHGGHRLSAYKDKLYSLVNFLCQGTAAEVLKEAIIRIDNAGLSDYIVLPVHDELIFDIPADEAEKLVPQLKELMEDHTSFSVPLTVEVSGPYQRWGEKYE